MNTLIGLKVHLSHPTFSKSHLNITNLVAKYISNSALTILRALK